MVNSNQSCAGAVPCPASKIGHALPFASESDRHEQLITSSPFSKGKLHPGLSPVWGFLCWSLLGESESIGMIPESRCLCGWIFVGVNTFPVNKLCFLNDLEPEWRERVTSGPRP